MIPTCPNCGATIYRLDRLPAEANLAQNTLCCGRCAADIRPLSPPGRPTAVYVPAPPEAQSHHCEPTPANWWFLACIQEADGAFVPATYCKTATQALDDLEWHRQIGAVLLMSVEPPPKARKPWRKS